VTAAALAEPEMATSAFIEYDDVCRSSSVIAAFNSRHSKRVDF